MNIFAKIANLYINPRLLLLLGVLVLLYCFSFFIPFLFLPTSILLIALSVLFVIDLLFVLTLKKPFSVQRKTNVKWSLSDENNITLLIKNNTKLNFDIIIIEDLPNQFQLRNYNKKAKIKSDSTIKYPYNLIPLQRGEYNFGSTHIIINGKLKLVQIKHEYKLHQVVAVYPSIIQMKKYELTLLSKTLNFQGSRKTKKIGQSYEFDQIKEYVVGDDIRHINWNNTGRTGTIMVNQYEDEKSQPIYLLIDKSRNMLFPHNGLTLMDYAINTSLAVSNIALKKQDKVGLITFSNKIGSLIKANNKSNQLNAIMNELYSQQERPFEANFELLYKSIRSVVKVRSLFILFTNFSHSNNIEEHLNILRKIHHQHVLIIVFFKNQQLIDCCEQNPSSIKDIYLQNTAIKSQSETEAIIYKLNKLGFNTIYTLPKDLSINTISRYLEIKAKGVI